MNKKYYYGAIVLIVAVAAWFRLGDLDRRPLWVDEAFFYFLIQEPLPYQEFVPVFIAKSIQIFTELDEFWLRLPFALTGIGTVLFLALYGKDRKAALIIALFVALFPLFVFWSKMARPYTMAAFFVVLGWRWKFFYIPAVLTTPTALIGVDFIEVFKRIKQNWRSGFIYLVILIIATGSFLIRPDTEKNWNLEFIYESRRLWIVPLITLCLYALRYLFPFLKSKTNDGDTSRASVE